MTDHPNLHRWIDLIWINIHLYGQKFNPCFRNSSHCVEALAWLKTHAIVNIMAPRPRGAILAECTCVATWYLTLCELCNLVSYLVWVVPNCQQEMVGQPVGRIKYKSLQAVQNLCMKEAMARVGMRVDLAIRCSCWPSLSEARGWLEKQTILGKTDSYINHHFQFHCLHLHCFLYPLHYHHKRE